MLSSSNPRYETAAVSQEAHERGGRLKLFRIYLVIVRGLVRLS